MGVEAAELLGTEAVPGKITTSTMKFVLMSLLLAGSSLAMDDMFKKIMKETAFHTFNAACFGENNKNLYDLAVGAAMEKCMQLAPAIDLINLLSPRSQFNSLFPSVNRKNPFEQFQAYKDIDQLTSLWRNKRSADASSGLIQIDEDDFIEFLEDFADYKGNMETKIVADPEWRARLSRGYQDCYDISESIPSQALVGNPLKRMFGRQMMFFKCAKKNEVTNCALGQMKRWVEQFYGTANNLTGYGLPEDAYEAAGLGLMVLNNAASEEEQFVSDFFWGAPGH